MSISTANKLVYYGNETLHKVAAEVMNIDQDIINLIESMFNIMYAERGIGLAAPQVAVSKRIVVLDIESYNGPSMALINPEITDTSAQIEPYEEGCLSVPGINAVIERPGEIAVKATTPEGKVVSFGANGLLARVLQHEIDHLNGRLFIDHLEDFERKELLGELKKIKKLNRTA